MSRRSIILDRLFLHFFDIHFLKQKAVWHYLDYALRECTLALRFAVLAGEEVILPAASFFESELCQAAIGPLEPIYPYGLIWLVGRGESLEEFRTNKLLQYPKNSRQYKAYASMRVEHVPPFRPRTNSASSDIALAWRALAESEDTFKFVVAGTDIRPPSDLETRWAQVPQKLENAAFIVEHVRPLLFRKKSPIVESRISSIINRAYFESFTKELQAGIVTELVYLDGPHPIPSFGRNLPYRKVLNEVRRQDLLPQLEAASAHELLELGSDPRWQVALEKALSIMPRESVVARHSKLRKEEQVDRIKAFIVHGHDKAAMLELKDYLQNVLKWEEPIVLAQQPSKGLTVIEKFERYQEGIDVVFVLLTPDDVGGKSTSPLLGRARQNVIFELGFFMGKFGRTSGRVILLYKGDLEIPSDLIGIVYIDISGGVLNAGETIRREVEDLGKAST